MSRFKLISKNDKFNYYHIDKNFEKNKKYELEYIDTLSIPNIDFNVLEPSYSLNFLDIKFKEFTC